MIDLRRVAINRIEWFCLNHKADERIKTDIRIIRDFINQHDASRPIVEVCEPYSGDEYYCPSCEEPIEQEDAFCKHCGKEIYWEVEED